MKYGFFSMGIILFGIITFAVLFMFESITINNDSEYYVLKESLHAAMLDSIDLKYWKEVDNNYYCKDKNDETVLVSGLKMSEQKFVEVFTRRFSSMLRNHASDYDIEFYDIMESPPKATVKIISHTRNYRVVSDDLRVVNGLTGILETNCYMNS